MNYVTNSSCKNVLKIEKTWPVQSTAFFIRFSIINTFLLHLYRKVNRYNYTHSYIRILINSPFGLSTFWLPIYVVLPKISENLLVITWILTLSPNFHRQLRSSHLGRVYNDPSDCVTFGNTHWGLPALACLVSIVAILLAPLQWRRNVALSTGVSF
jgi:hypothetical protein